MRNPATFGPTTTTEEVLDGIDLRGRVALITGGSSGLGQETARALAKHGAEVILTARDQPKGEAVAAGIRAATGNDRVAVEALELGVAGEHPSVRGPRAGATSRASISSSTTPA